MLMVALAACAADAAQHGDDHTATLEVLAGIQTAIADITSAENGQWSGPAQYKAAVSRALATLEGANGDPRESARDAGGAIGRIEHLLDRQDEEPWEPILEGALVNIRAAVASLRDASDSRSLDDFNLAATQALESLEVAQGRTSDPGVLGGMSGAAANTVLAVPSGAKSLDGCRLPQEAGYGVRDGYLAYRALPLPKDRTQLVAVSGGENIRLSGDMLVIYTAAAPLVQQRCENKR